jgi:NADH-ubiquinone oxidoreductase chain 5
MYLTLILLPLLSSLLPGLLGRKIGVQGTHLITCISISISTILSMLIFTEVGLNSIPVEIKLFK